MTDPSSLTYYAHRIVGKEGTYYTTIHPNLRFVELHCFPDPIVRVSVRERLPTDPPSRYWGWLSNNRDYYQFVWPTFAQVDTCFPYGIASEEALGRGRRVNLVITELPEGA